MKQFLKNSLSRLNFVSKYYSGIATIFMLHRVCPLDSNMLWPNEGMKVSPEYLGKLIFDLKCGGFDFISLDALHQILLDGGRADKKIVFTLDDGYKDNHDVAYPIFRKYGIPFTIYITTSFPERTAILWWYVLEDLLVRNTEIVLSGVRYGCRTEQEKVDVFLKTREVIISLGHQNYCDELDRIFEGYGVDWSAKCRDLAMSWDQIQDLSQDPLVTIGGHTKNHYSLSRLSEDEIEREVLDANRLIENRIAKKVEHFSYPFGGRAEVAQREFSLVKRMKFKTATTTRSGNIYSEHVRYFECLPRVMLTENICAADIGLMRRSRVVTA